MTESYFGMDPKLVSVQLLIEIVDQELSSHPHLSDALLEKRRVAHGE